MARKTTTIKAVDTTIEAVEPVIEKGSTVEEATETAVRSEIRKDGSIAYFTREVGA